MFHELLQPFVRSSIKKKKKKEKKQKLLAENYFYFFFLSLSVVSTIERQTIKASLNIEIERIDANRLTPTNRLDFELNLR